MLRLWLASLGMPILWASGILNESAFDASAFRVTTFASGLSAPNSVLARPSGSLIVVMSQGFTTSQVALFQDVDKNGIADGPPTVLYSNANFGPGVQIRRAKDLYYIGEFGATAITALAPGAAESDPLSVAGRLSFSYPPGHGHPTPGFAVRPTPGDPQAVDLVFNIGSQFNNALSTDPVTISGFGLGPTALDGDSLYMVTIRETGGTALASNPRQVATGIRNVYGMAFDPASGDLYFADNAIDEDVVTTTSEPPQADELNRIPAADLGVNVLRFGYPDCYRAYRTNDLVETAPGTCGGVTQSLFQFQPIPNTASGSRSEGPAEIAFSPALFPAPFQGGIFAGFSGGVGPGGVNNQNAVVFVDSLFGQALHFVASGTPGIGNILGVHSTQDSLFLADWNGGTIYQVTALPVPETGSFPLVGFGLLALGLFYRARRW